jgi:hypothetical protein
VKQPDDNKQRDMMDESEAIHMSDKAQDVDQGEIRGGRIESVGQDTRHHRQLQMEWPSPHRKLMIPSVEIEPSFSETSSRQTGSANRHYWSNGRLTWRITKDMIMGLIVQQRTDGSWSY